MRPFQRLAFNRGTLDSHSGRTSLHLDSLTNLVLLQWYFSTESTVGLADLLDVFAIPIRGNSAFVEVFTSANPPAKVLAANVADFVVNSRLRIARDLSLNLNRTARLRTFDR